MPRRCPASSKSRWVRSSMSPGSTIRVRTAAPAAIVWPTGVFWPTRMIIGKIDDLLANKSDFWPTRMTTVSLVTRLVVDRACRAGFSRRWERAIEQAVPLNLSKTNKRVHYNELPPRLTKLCSAGRPADPSRGHKSRRYGCGYRLKDE